VKKNLTWVNRHSVITLRWLLVFNKCNFHRVREPESIRYMRENIDFIRF